MTKKTNKRYDPTTNYVTKIEDAPVGTDWDPGRSFAVESEDERAYEGSFTEYGFKNVSGTPSGARIEGLPTRSMEHVTKPVPPPPDRSMEGSETWKRSGPRMETARPGERFREVRRRKRSTG